MVKKGYPGLIIQIGPGFLFLSQVIIGEIQMPNHLPKLFKISSTDQYPVYTLRNGKIYRTVFHSKGWSENPDYEFGNDGKFYRTEYHELGANSLPDYEFHKDQKVYRTENHPNGIELSPEYEIRD